MKNIRKIMIIGIIVFLSFTIISCENVLEVRRIDSVSSAAEKQASPLVEDETHLKIADQSSPEIDEDNKEEENLGQTAKQVDEKLGAINNSNKEQNEKIEKENKTVENVVEKAGSEENSGLINEKNNKAVLSLLFLTNTYKEGAEIELTKNFIVGKDHFAHLVAEMFTTKKAEHKVNIVWKNVNEDIIYKKETLTLKADEKSLIRINSSLGLTKKVSGQEILPDALGEYLVIFEVDGILIGKTGYAIVAE